MYCSRQTIQLSDLLVYAFHGVDDRERTAGAWFSVSVSIDAPVMEAVITDRVENTVNYATVAQIVKDEMKITSNLLEHVAGRISERIIREFPCIHSLTITVAKKNPPVCLQCASSSVTLTYLID